MAVLIEGVSWEILRMALSTALDSWERMRSRMEDTSLRSSNTADEGSPGLKEGDERSLMGRRDAPEI